jgi:hypothetical protein
MAEERKNMRVREFAGAVNRAKEVLVLVQFSAEHEEGSMWLPIAKSAAKEIVDHAKEHGIEEVENVMEDDGCLYLDVPDDDGEEDQKDEE